MATLGWTQYIVYCMFLIVGPRAFHKHFDIMFNLLYLFLFSYRFFNSLTSKMFNLILAVTEYSLIYLVCHLLRCQHSHVVLNQYVGIAL